MDPVRLIPSPDILPAPWWLFYILLVATFTLHLIVANVMLGGGIMALMGEWFKRREEKDNALSMRKEIAPKLPMTIALTVNLGVPPLLFLQILYGNFIYVSTMLMAVYWLSIFVLIILAYYGAYLYNLKYDRLAGLRTWVMGVSVLMMLAVGFFFTNSLLIMTDPKVWPTYFDRTGRHAHSFRRTEPHSPVPALRGFIRGYGRPGHGVARVVANPEGRCGRGRDRDAGTSRLCLCRPSSISS